MVASAAFFSSANAPRPPTDGATRAAASSLESRHDAVLVDRFNQGDESAFVDIFTRHQGKVFSITFSVLRNRADAEEITNDTFVRAYRALTRFRGDSALATWLHRIALNLSRNRYWHNFRRRRHVTQSFDCAFSPDNPATLASLVVSTAPDPGQVAEITEFSALVAKCMERLGPMHREILTQRNTLNCSYGRIAQSLGISIGTVKSRIARARENLRLQLSAACPEFAPDAAPNQWLDHPRWTGQLQAISA